VTDRPERGRIRRLRMLMREHTLDALLVTRREDVRYLTGFTGSAGSLLVNSGRPCLITDFRYQLQAGRETEGIRVLIQKKDFISALRDVLGSAASDGLWFDASSLTVEELGKFKKAGVRLRGRPDLVRELRLLKDKQELKHIRTAIRRAEESFRELKQFIKPGATEKELGVKLEFLMREKGARRAAFDTIVASGPNGAMPHAAATNRRIRANDLVTFDFGSEADGYVSDMTRTYCIGRPSSKQREIHELVMRAQETAIRSIRPGVACRLVDEAARGVIQQAGHAGHFGHGTGHGVGLMVHEGPSVSRLSKDRVEKNMVFTVEPGVYVPGWGGVRIEDMVLVTETGARSMTSLPREIDGLKHL
jgi:Xaa-Pro aminopeptidase